MQQLVKFRQVKTQMIAKFQRGHLGYNFLILVVTHYSCQAPAHAFFFVRAHSLFHSPRNCGNRCGVCLVLEWEKLKCQTLEREEIVVERWRMECKGSRTM